jgi:hypothetical protein
VFPQVPIPVKLFVRIDALEDADEEAQRFLQDV